MEQRAPRTPTARAAPARTLDWPVLLVSASFAFVNFALPLRARELGASGVAVGGLFALFMVFLVVGRPIAGWALDRYGRRPFLIASLAVYVVSMGIYGLGESLPGFLAGRALQGAAAAMFWVTARTMVADLAPEGERGHGLGRVMALSARGSILGAGWGFGVLALAPEALAWPVIFAGFAAGSLVGLHIAIRRAPETLEIAPNMRGAERVRLDGPFVGLLGISAAAGFAAALAFPMLLLRLQDETGREMLELGLLLVPAAVVMALVPTRAGRLADRRGPVLCIAGGLTVGALASLALALLKAPLVLAAAFTLFAAGAAMAEPATAAIAAGRGNASSRGRSYGLYEMALGLGGVGGPVLGGWLYDAGGSPRRFSPTWAFCSSPGSSQDRC